MAPFPLIDADRTERSIGNTRVLDLDFHLDARIAHLARRIRAQNPRRRKLISAAHIYAFAMREIVPIAARGPATQFTQAHALQLLLELRSKTRLGRQALARRIGIGEGSVRTLLAKLTDRSFIHRSRGGVALSGEGRAFIASLGIDLAPVDAGELTVGAVDRMVHLRAGAEWVTTGTAQRDAAMLAGAAGATTFCFSHNRLRACEMTDDLAETAPTLAAQIEAAFVLQEGDVVIIGTADDAATAATGALAAALDLGENL